MIDVAKSKFYNLGWIKEEQQWSVIIPGTKFLYPIIGWGHVRLSCLFLDICEKLGITASDLDCKFQETKNSLQQRTFGTSLLCSVQCP